MIFVQINVVEGMSMKKNWETSDTPYLFFNEDGTTFTTLGFYVEMSKFAHRATLCNERRKNLLMKNTTYILRKPKPPEASLKS